MKVSQLVVLLALLLGIIAGCSKNDSAPKETEKTPETINSPLTTTTVPEETVPWIGMVGMPWDREGALTEIPLTIPDGLHYRSAMNFDGDLLLWSVDAHLADSKTLEMCLVDLKSGDVLGQADVLVSDYLVPQVLDGKLYICDSISGDIFALDKSLEIAQKWHLTADNGTWYMGANEKVYHVNNDLELFVSDLSTGASEQLLPGAKNIWTYMENPDLVSVEYYSAETGAKTSAILDLITGEICHDPFGEDFYSISKFGNTWLCGKYNDRNIYYFQYGEVKKRIETGEDYLEILSEDRILRTTSEAQTLRIYTFEGNCVAQCNLQESYGMYYPSCMIWSDTYNGYFLWLVSEGDASRLLFWDISVPSVADSLTFEDIPEPSEEESLLKSRAEELSLEYGLTILVSTDCVTEFDDFSATLATDYDDVTSALNVLDNALSKYPDGFLEQLRYGGIQGIKIQLISDLQAHGGGREGGGYNAFAQNCWDHYLIVIDIDDSTEDTYYHEFSHVIDSYLAWDASQREDALFSEDGWSDRNPAWFEGYTYDYSWEQNVNDFSWFIDTYSTISPTEDRARVMEYAMSEYGYWYFYDCPGLEGKLDYYCRCIRDAFDTEGWPETVPWEQYN